ncbi:MAG: Uma2 family endonuclease [Nitrospirae bacterium]|nr:Uma2 family endonuclease [Nitrospirota bacterium]
MLSDSDKTLRRVLYYFMDTTIEIERDFDLTDTLTEIINGVETMTPAPSWTHQIKSKKLYDMINHHIVAKGLGELYYSPLDVIFEDGTNRFQPDLLFIRKENMPLVITDCVRIVPDMVCEIVSKGSYERDIEDKKTIYEKYRVPEYWIVIPELQTIEILTVEGDKYKLHSIAALNGVVTSKVIEGLTVNVNDIFE